MEVITKYYIKRILLIVVAVGLTIVTVERYSHGNSNTTTIVTCEQVRAVSAESSCNHSTPIIATGNHSNHSGSHSNHSEDRPTSYPRDSGSRDRRYLVTLVRELRDPLSYLPDSGYMEEYTRSFCWISKDGTVRCLPGAYLAGMPKCGTTDLYWKLVSQDTIVKPPAGKENMFWTRSRLGRPIGMFQTNRRTPETMESYTGRMTPPDMSRDQLILDGSPDLLYEQLGWEDRYPWAESPPYHNSDLIHLVSPAAKVIAMVRDPTERLWSDYLYFDHGEVRTPRTFQGHVREEIARFTTCLLSRDLPHCCSASDNSMRVRLHLGIYHCYLPSWSEAFRDNLLILTLRQYSQDRLATVERVFGFLGVEVDVGGLSEVLVSSETHNTRHGKDVGKGDMLHSTRSVLDTFYKPYNKLFADYFNNSDFLFKRE